MSLQITRTAMTSTQTRHTAAAEDGRWTVSWLPGRVLSQSEAVTAMTLAEIVTVHDLSDPGDPMWGHVGSWAAELGMLSVAAVDAIGAAAPQGPARGRGEAR